MQTLSLFIVTTIAFGVWIALDKTTEEVFDAFGSYFFIVWRTKNVDRRWHYRWAVGWRLLLFIAFPFACTCFAYQFWFANTFDLSIGQRSLSCLAIGLTGCFIFPWIRINERRRMWKRARQAISGLSNFVERLESGGGFAAEVKAADY